MQMVVYIVSPLFDLFLVAFKTYLAPIIREVPLLFWVVYLPSTWLAGISIADRNCLQPLALRSDTIVGELFLAGRAVHHMYGRRLYSQTIAISDSGR